MAVSRRSIGSVSRIWVKCASLAVLLGVAAPGLAQTVSVYRCVGADGRVALQDRPCPPGQLDRHREARIEAPPVAASLPPPVEAPVTEDAPPEAGPQPAEPPPPLWVCVDFEGKQRFADGNDPRPRYVPYWVVAGNPAGPRGIAGRGGRPAPRAGGSGPGAPDPAVAGLLPPMVLVEDQCRQLTDESACRSYRALRAAADRQRYNSVGDARREAEAELDRLREILVRHCGG